MLALASSHLDSAIPASTLIVGEVGLGGEIRAVSQLPRRLAEAAKLGFKAAVVPEANKDLSGGPRGLKLTNLRHTTDALDWLRAC